MKKLLIALFFLFLFVNSFAQVNPLPGQAQSTLTGGFGLTWIDGAPTYALRIRPDVSFKNIGIGLDLNLEIDASGNLRKENFNTASDYLSIIRYIRYGYKKDPVYAQVGAVDYYTLGHGSIMYQYSNSPSVDNKKIGLVLDLNMDKWGFESIYSDFSEGSVVGARVHVKPLQFTAMSIIPIISGLEIGASFAGDYNSKAGIETGTINPTTNTFNPIIDNGSMSIYGFDIGLPLLTTPFFNIDLYADYAKIVNFGDGVSSGLLLNFNGLGLATASLKFERRWNSKEYIPSYFGSLYEIERFNASYVSSTQTKVSSKAADLRAAIDPQNGFFGSLSVDVLHLVNLYGGYQRLDKNPQSGILNMRAEVAPTSLPFVARAGYDKTNIIDEKDLFTLDNRSALFAELGYKPYSYLLVSMIYQWTFTPLRDKDDNVIGFEPQKKIEPRISFIYPF